MSTAVTETRVPRSSDRILALPERVRRRPLGPYAAVMALGALIILAGLGRSSLFIDETFSWNASNHGVQGIIDAVQQAEVTPPLYYVILHAWIGLTGAESELALRLPSALAGIALIGAVSWFGTLVADRRTGVLAGLLTALSPLVLQYAQEVRAYVFVMLAVTVTAAAAIQLTREPERRRWLVLALTGAVVSVFLHYTAVLVLFPLSLWLLRQPGLSRAGRLGVGGAALLAFVVLLPLLKIQLDAGHHNAEADAYAKITPIGLLRLFGTPFDGRALDGMAITYELGLLALVDAVALLALADRFRHLHSRWMLVGACVLPLAVVLLVSSFMQPLALTRYTAVAAPFMLVVLAVVVLRVPRALGRTLLALAVVAGVIGIVAAQLPRGQWPDTRGAFEAAAEQVRPGDVVVGLENMAFADAMSYYGRDLAKPPKGYFSAQEALGSRAAQRALDDGRRVFVISSPPADWRQLHTAADQQRATVGTPMQFGGSYPVRLDVVRGR